MYPELFTIGPFTVHSFGLMMALGFVFAGVLAHFEFKRRGMNMDEVYWLTLAAAVGGITGSKIHYILLHLDELGDDPLATTFSGAGLVWFGGLIGGLLAASLVARLYKVSVARVLDAGAMPLALGYAFGRMGCFLNGDDWGKPSDLPWAMEFPKGSPPTPPGVSVHPTQLYEISGALIILGILYFLRPRLRNNWAMITAFLMLGGIERFLVEFLRMEREGQLQQQYLALAMAIGAGVALFFIQRRKPEPSRPAASRRKPAPGRKKKARSR